jgi:hypothetical protein
VSLLPDQGTGDHRALVDIEASGAFDNGFHDCLRGLVAAAAPQVKDRDCPTR